jgi:hypothetical protein
MNMKNPFACTVFLLMLSISTFAQDGISWDWKPGLYIQNNGDTVHGFIDNRPSSSNQRLCYFKSNEQAEIQRFNPGQILGYQISGGRFYKSRIIKFPGKEIPMFLEVLFQGECSIYYYLGEENRYFAEKDSQFVELHNTKKELAVNGGYYEREKKEYIGTLSIFMQDARIQNEIQKCKLERESLIRIAKFYHKKLHPEEDSKTFEKKDEKINLDFGFTVGRNNTSNLVDEYGYYTSTRKVTFYGGPMVSLKKVSNGSKIFSLNAGLLLNTYYLQDKKKNCLYIPLYAGFKLVSKELYPQIEAGVSGSFVQSAVDMEPFIGVSIHCNGEGYPHCFLDAHYDIFLKNFRFGFGLLF